MMVVVLMVAVEVMMVALVIGCLAYDQSRTLASNLLR